MILTDFSRSARILIDGREISKKRGLGHFCRELLYNINENADLTETKYFCLVPHGTEDVFENTFKNIEFITKKLRNPILWEQLTLPMEASRHRATHIICPYNTFPILLSRCIVRLVVYHDLIFLHPFRVGGGLKLTIGNIYRSFLIKYIRKSDILLTVSDYTKELMLKFLGTNSVLIGNSCEYMKSMLAHTSGPSDLAEYFLHIGGDALTKNTKHIISTFLEARKTAGPSFPRLVVMGVSRKFAETLKSLLPMGDEVQFRFNISEEEKNSLIKGAIAIVFVSTREGFGLPILEAHAAGRPVITSRRRPMSDIAAEGDVLVSPIDEGELIAAYASLARRPTTLSCFDKTQYDEIAQRNQFHIIEELLRQNVT